MKNKKSLILCVGLLLGCMVLTSCGKDEKKQEATPSIVLSVNTLTLEVGEEKTITATATSEEISWAVTDPTICSVDAGKVTGLKAGSTVLTASINGASIEAEITVTRPSVVGTLSVNYDSIDLFVGNSQVVEASVMYKNAKLSGLEYTWSTEDTNISLVPNKEKVTINAISLGDAEVTVSTVHLGETLVETLDVHVKDNIELSISNLDFEEDAYKLNMLVSKPEGYESELSDSFVPEFSMKVNGQAQVPSSVSIVIPDEYKDIVAYNAESNALTALKAGHAEVTCEVEYKGKKYSLTIEIEAALAEVELDEVIDIELRSDKALLAGIEGTAKAVKIDNEDQTFENSEEGILLTSHKSLEKGSHTLYVETEELAYIGRAEVVTMVIKTKEDLNLMSTFGADNVWDGYFVLANDIEYNDTFVSYAGRGSGIPGWGGVTGFVGTFDGRGHTIKGLTIDGDNLGNKYFCGMFGVLGTAGVVKNVGFEDAHLKSADCSGIIAELCYGTVENVFVELDITSNMRGAAITPMLYGSIKNCVVYVVSAIDSTVAGFEHSNVALASFTYPGSQVSNCYSVGPVELYRTGGDAPVVPEYNDSLKSFATFEDMKAVTIDAEAWNSAYWVIEEGIISFKSYSAEARIASFDLNKGAESTEITIPELMGNVASVTVGETAVEFAQDGKKLTLSGYGALPFGENDLTIKTDVKTLKGKVLVCTVISTAAQWNAEVATFNNSESNEWDNYYVLGADLDFENAIYASPKGELYGAVYGFKGTFDGRNHQIKNLYIAGECQSFFGAIAVTAKVMNVAFTNATLTYIADPWVSTNKSGLIADLFYGTIENVYVQFDLLSGHWWTGGIANFAYECAHVNNLIVDITSFVDGAGTNSTVFDTCVDGLPTMNNLFVYCATAKLMSVGTSPDAQAQTAETDTMKTYADAAALKDAGQDLSGFPASVWDTTAGYPVFKFAA